MTLFHSIAQGSRNAPIGRITSEYFRKQSESNICAADSALAIASGNTGLVPLLLIPSTALCLQVDAPIIRSMLGAMDVMKSTLTCLDMSGCDMDVHEGGVSGGLHASRFNQYSYNY